MEQLTFKVQEMEGPLDLILQLIQKHQLNIYDIEISQLLEQYMAVMETMRENQLEISSAFLEMASRLVYMKSAMLLPRHEREEDPRRELEGALLEYQACRLAAERLRARSVGNERFVRMPLLLEDETLYTQEHPPYVLRQAYLSALGRGQRHMPPSREVFRGIVAHRVVSVASRITVLLTQLYTCGTVWLEPLFEQCLDRPECVATFLAVLELIRDKRAFLEGDTQLTLAFAAASPMQGGEADAL